MDKNKNVPEIRFDGFAGEWKKLKIKNFANVVGGGTPSTLNLQYWNGDISWYTPAEIDGSRYIYASRRKITNLGLQSCSAIILPALRTVLFTSRAGIGKAAILATDACTNQGFQSIVLERDMSADFIYSLSGRIKKEAEKIASGSTFTEISGKKLSDVSVFVANSDEQLIIGNFFKNLDKKIDLEKEKHRKLINFKKAMLDDMFPKEGEKVPKVRFEGFNDKWKSEQLGNISTYSNGSTYENEVSNNGKYELINLNSVSINGGLKSSRKFINFANKTLLRNDLVMILSDVAHGNLLGRVALIPEDNKYVLNQRVASLSIISNHNPHFLFYFINSNQHYFKKNGAGSSQLNLSRNAVESFLVKFSSLEEQALIGNFFKNLDEKIELTEKRIKKIENFKKSMLEKMFV